MSKEAERGESKQRNGLSEEAIKAVEEKIRQEVYEEMKEPFMQLQNQKITSLEQEKSNSAVIFTDKLRNYFSEQAATKKAEDTLKTVQKENQELKEEVQKCDEVIEGLSGQVSTNEKSIENARQTQKELEENLRTMMQKTKELHAFHVNQTKQLQDRIEEINGKFKPLVMELKDEIENLIEAGNN